ncbi:MAG: hypothetical protein FD187_3243 [bacterium]|nr:MAG: hypothetical protein FD187_3243 [bacterium]
MRQRRRRHRTRSSESGRPERRVRPRSRNRASQLRVSSSPARPRRRHHSRHCLCCRLKRVRPRTNAINTTAKSMPLAVSSSIRPAWRAKTQRAQRAELGRPREPARELKHLTPTSVWQPARRPSSWRPRITRRRGRSTRHRHLLRRGTVDRGRGRRKFKTRLVRPKTLLHDQPHRHRWRHCRTARYRSQPNPARRASVQRARPRQLHLRRSRAAHPLRHWSQPDVTRRAAQRPQYLRAPRPSDREHLLDRAHLQRASRTATMASRAIDRQR